MRLGRKGIVRVVDTILPNVLTLSTIQFILENNCIMFQNSTSIFRKNCTSLLTHDTSAASRLSGASSVREQHSGRIMQRSAFRFKTAFPNTRFHNPCHWLSTELWTEGCALSKHQQRHLVFLSSTTIHKQMPYILPFS